MLNYTELLLQFTSTDFKLRYKNSVLGILWVVLKPLMMFAITYTVWSALFNDTDPNYKMNLLLGLMIMNFLSDGVMIGLTSLISKAHIILKINFPREVVVMSSTFTSIINFLVNMIVFAVFALFSPIDVTLIGFLLFFLSMLAVYFIILGVSLFLSVLYVRLRDIHQLVEVGLQVLFWATPVFYPLSMLPENLQQIIKLNPMTYLVVEARKGLNQGSIISGQDFVSVLVILSGAIILALLGHFFFKRYVTKIAEYF